MPSPRCALVLALGLLVCADAGALADGEFLVIADGRARVTATWEGLRDGVTMLANFRCRGRTHAPATG